MSDYKYADTFDSASEALDRLASLAGSIQDAEYTLKQDEVRVLEDKKRLKALQTEWDETREQAVAMCPQIIEGYNLPPDKTVELVDGQVKVVDTAAS